MGLYQSLPRVPLLAVAQPRTTHWQDRSLIRGVAGTEENFGGYYVVEATSNLLPLQQDLLQSLPANDSYLYPLADKGLGPCGVLTEQYIEDALIHLCNEEVYEQLTEEEATQATDVLHTEIKDWLEEYRSIIGEDAYKYINHHLRENFDSPYGQFYI
eukprot:scaffold12642_cov53-Cyclotella_meneghiniana.AAC.3